MEWQLNGTNTFTLGGNLQALHSSNHDVVAYMTHCVSGCNKTINWVNTLRPRQNCRHFADNIFKCIFLNENEWIWLMISLTFVPKVRINNIPALVWIMAWRRPGDKPLSIPRMVSLLTHICVTRPQWVNMMAAYTLVSNINHADLSMVNSTPTSVLGIKIWSKVSARKT